MALAALMCSCTKQQESEKSSEELIIGEWEVVSLREFGYEGGEWYDFENMDGSFVETWSFLPDNTMVEARWDNSGRHNQKSLTWKIVDDTLICMYVNLGGGYMYKIDKLEAKTMELSARDEDENVFVKLKRVK